VTDLYVLADVEIVLLYREVTILCLRVYEQLIKEEKYFNFK